MSKARYFRVICSDRVEVMDSMSTVRTCECLLRIITDRGRSLGAYHAEMVA